MTYVTVCYDLRLTDAARLPSQRRALEHGVRGDFKPVLGRPANLFILGMRKERGQIGERLQVERSETALITK
jgi:hypothetical protein